VKINAPLYQAILDDPWSDPPRLRYADWLEQAGDTDRAEYIRLQIALDGVPRNDPAHRQAWERHWDLYKRNRDRWEDELPELPGVTWSWDHRRGFVSEVYAQDVACLLRSEAEVLSVPFDTLSMFEWHAEGTLYGSAILARLRQARLGRSTFSSSLPAHEDDRRLTSAMSWLGGSGITRLGLQRLLLSPGGVRALAEAPLPALSELSWERGSYTDHDHLSLSGARWLPRLAHLALKHHPFDHRSLAALLAALSPSLRQLRLEAAKLDDACATTLAASGLLQSLTSLELPRNGIGAQGLREILSVLHPDASLVMDDNPLGAEGTRLLLDSPHGRRSEVLKVQGPIDEHGLRAIAQAPESSRVHTLHLPRLPLPERGLDALLTSPHLSALSLLVLTHGGLASLPPAGLPALATLVADHNALTGDGLVRFCEESALPALKRLNLSHNRIDEAGARALVRARGLQTIEYLDLRVNPLGRAGVAALLSGEGLPSLRELELGECGLENDDLPGLLDLPLLGRLASLGLVRTSHTLGEKPDNRVGGEAFQRFQREAFQRGCSVNLYQPPKWGEHRSIVAPDSGPLPASERRVLAGYLATLVFSEYATCGWLKVTTVSELASHTHDSASRQTLAAYQAGDRGGETIDDVIVLLSGWMASQVPESVCGWDIERAMIPSFMTRSEARELEIESAVFPPPITRPEARAIAEQIAHESGETELRGVRPAFAPKKPRAIQRISYASLPGWFDRVLGDDAVFYQAKGPTLLGLDAEHIAVFWLE
jgi:uncharacterized protein (TIGR02996 family)